MSIKVYLHVELDGYPQKTSKIQIPKSWAEKEVRDVMGLFTKAYNDKNPDNQINIDEFHLARNDGERIFSNDTVTFALEEHVDYYFKPGAHLRVKEVQEEQSNQNLVRCRNFGCNQFYSEDDNGDGSCLHHTGPPIFHDTMKCWSCCRDKKAYDFETFQQIQGCNIGRHSSVPKTVSIAPSPNAPKESNSGSSAPVAPLKSIADFNTSNPNAASSIQTAIKSTVRKSSRNADGVTARCQRKGCQKTFTIADNTAISCTYHKGQAIFHDAIKKWSCCPEKNYYDFDEFLAVPGCAVGYHDDGEIELNDG